MRMNQTEYYGHDGPIMVNTSVLPILDLWMQAGSELGYETHDPNGFQREGFAPMNVALRNGKRSSSYIEYVKPHEGSRNTLTVIRYANVSEVTVFLVAHAVHSSSTTTFVCRFY